MRNIKAASCSDKEEGEEDRVKTEEERKSETPTISSVLRINIIPLTSQC